MARVWGWKPDIPDPRDQTYRAPAFALDALPPRVDLRPGCSPVENQGQVGSCTGNAIAGAIEYLDNVDGIYTDISRLFIYYNERKIEGTIRTDCGAMIRTGIKVVAKTGAASEHSWPYIEKKWANRPSLAAYADAYLRRIADYRRVVSARDVLHCLAAGLPVVFGFSVFESFESDEVARTGVMPMPDIERERQLGGHAVLAVGYDLPSRQVICRNSWGPQWGAAGYFLMPMEVIEDKNLSDDFWVITRRPRSQ